jgi:hypothetical protein
MSALGIDELIPIGASFFFCCRREPACRSNCDVTLTAMHRVRPSRNPNTRHGRHSRRTGAGSSITTQSLLFAVKLNATDRCGGSCSLKTRCD